MKMDRTETPILFLVFNRLEPTKRVFQQIKAARPSKLYIASDGPRPDRPGEEALVDSIRQYLLREVDWDCALKTLFRPQNLGCRYGISSAISWLFENEESGIILEDDCLPSRSFFGFCQEILDRYKDDPRVMCIVGYNLIDYFPYTNESYVFSNIGFSWGWATWRLAWKIFDVEMRDWALAKENMTTRGFPFNADRNLRWEMTYQKQVDSWFYVCDFYKALSCGLSIVPCKSMIQNIGFGPNATHTKNIKARRASVQAQDTNWPLRHPKLIRWNVQDEHLLWDALYAEIG